MKVNIPKPCHEDWNKMDLQEKGRFCGSCQKLVVDFTAMSDSEIVKYFKDYKNQNTCGHFKKTQIDRSLKPQEMPHRKLFLKEQQLVLLSFWLLLMQKHKAKLLLINIKIQKLKIKKKKLLSMAK